MSEEWSRRDLSTFSHSFGNTRLNFTYKWYKCVQEKHFILAADFTQLHPPNINSFAFTVLQYLKETTYARPSWLLVIHFHHLFINKFTWYWVQFTLHTCNTQSETFELFRVRQAGTYPSMHWAKATHTSFRVSHQPDQSVFGLQKETQVLLCKKLTSRKGYRLVGSNTLQLPKSQLLLGSNNLHTESSRWATQQVGDALCEKLQASSCLSLSMNAAFSKEILSSNSRASGVVCECSLQVLPMSVGGSPECSGYLP